MIITGQLPKSVKDYSKGIKLYLIHPLKGLIIFDTLDLDISDAKFYVTYSGENRLVINRKKFIFNGVKVPVLNLINYF